MFDLSPLSERILARLGKPMWKDPAEDAPRPAGRGRQRTSYGCEHDLVVGAPESILYCRKCKRTWIATSVFFGSQREGSDGGE